MKDLLEAGVHFGHQTKRWNPKMKEFIFGERNGIYIIDLNKTVKKFRDAEEFVTNLAADGRTVLFVGTKRQAQDVISEEAQRCGMYFINQRWLGGLLTNFTTIQRSLGRLRDLEAMVDRRPLRHALQEGDRAQREGEAQAPQEPRRHPPDVAAARRDLRRRHAQGEDRGRRGAQAEDPGHRHRRHQLRSGRGGLRRSPATTTRCVRFGCSRRRSPTRSSAGRGMRESRIAEEDAATRRRSRRRRRRRAPDARGAAAAPRARRPRPPARKAAGHRPS